MLCRFIALLIAVALSLLPCVAHSQEIAVPFKRIGPFGGDVRSLLIDSKRKGVAYLGTSNGKLFKTSDSGKSWNPLHPGIRPYEYVIDTLIQHPGEKDRLYAGSWDLHSDGGGLFESKNAGQTWTRMNLPSSSAVRGFDICNANPKYMIAGALAGVYVSSDEGRNWKKVGGSDLEKAESVAIDPKDYRRLYVGTWRLGYRSGDFGRTWTRVDKGMPLDSDLFSISPNPRSPEIVYASACSGVYRSSDRAASWKRLKLRSDRYAIRAQIVYLDPTDPNRIYVGTTEGLYFSPDDGKSWARLTSADITVNAIQVDPENSRRILIGTEYHGIMISEDGGGGWKESNSGFVHRQIPWVLPDPLNARRYFFGLHSGVGGLCIYDSRKGNWDLSQIESGMRIFSFLILPQNQGYIAGGAQGVHWREKGGGPWKKLTGPIAKRTVYSLEIDPGGSVIYAGTDHGIYRTSVSAMNFRTPPNYRFSPKVWRLTASKGSPGAVYAGTSMGLLRSWDKGTTWNVVSAAGLPDRAVIESVAVSPSDSNHLFAGTPVGLFESLNGGIHWRRAGDERTRAAISSILFLDGSGKNVLAANKTSGGVFLSRNGGETWVLVHSPENDSPVYCLARDPEQPATIYLGTRSDGVYVLRFPDDIYSFQTAGGR